LIRCSSQRIAIEAMNPELRQQAKKDDRRLGQSSDVSKDVSGTCREASVNQETHWFEGEIGLAPT
jgi:hypothetical protein